MLTFLEPTAVGGFMERRVLFVAGQEVDFSLLPLAAAAHLTERAEITAVLMRGFRVLVDKLGLEPALRRGVSTGAPPRRLPTPAAFEQLTHDFWYHVLWAAKKLRRGEAWIAKQSCDGHLKALLVDLLAWQAQTTDRQVDAWHGGRFLECWADRRALDGLRHAYARYEASDIARALWATIDLIRQRLGEILHSPA